MHVLLIDSHKSKALYQSGLSGLSTVLSTVNSAQEALELQLPDNIHDELSFRILGYVGQDKPSRYVPLYHCLPPKVKVSMLTLETLSTACFGYRMSRFLTNSRRVASIALFAAYTKWPPITDRAARLELYSSYGSWLYKGLRSVPEPVAKFCSDFGLPTHEVRKWPVDMLFGSPNYGKKQVGKVEMLDVVNCAAQLDYDVVSLARPTLSAMIEDWRSNK